MDNASINKVVAAILANNSVKVDKGKVSTFELVKQYNEILEMLDKQQQQKDQKEAEGIAEYLREQNRML